MRSDKDKSESAVFKVKNVVDTPKFSIGDFLPVFKKLKLPKSRNLSASSFSPFLFIYSVPV